MLPRILCEELCSLNSGVDRLTFSVIWKIDDEGNVYSNEFGEFFKFKLRKKLVDKMMRIVKGLRALVLRDKLMETNDIDKSLSYSRVSRVPQRNVVPTAAMFNVHMVR